ncbi:uncharacterized protein TNCV_3967431 [Trichonephila clavipes]|nr:uncharacterized protein TNCV_3967431 [Trichonephila clavipes]
MERGWPIVRPLELLDKTPLDVFLWEYVKSIVYQTVIDDTSERKSRITAAIQIVDFAMLHRTWLEISYRLDVSRITNDALTEIVRQDFDIMPESLSDGEDHLFSVLRVNHHLQATALQIKGKETLPLKSIESVTNS